jgi:tRNA(Ile)-lysidine synthase
MKNLIKKIQNTIFENSLFERDAKIVLGISGGPDSSALLDIFCKLKPKYNLELLVAHVNYNLRGADSKKDAAFVVGLAKKYNLPIITLDSRVKEKNNLEEKLRDIRYAFFERIRKEHDFELIAVAHNLDDQAETVLMRLIRGSGMLGLSSMQFKNDTLIRPLLDTTRKDIIAYLKDAKLSYRIDKTNAQSIFLRNKIRNKLLPYIEKEYNPKIKQILANTASTLSEDYLALEEVVKQALDKNKILSVKKILTLPRAIQKRVLEKTLTQKNCKNKSASFSQINEILKALHSTKGKNQVIALGSLKMIRRGDMINIEFQK